MSRRHISFACSGEELAGTLDDAAGTIGLLIVSGGNETRAGAFSGQAQLAARIAEAGFPVFRFDRRGIGDSCGKNSGFKGSASDIAAATEAFRASKPELTGIVAFGNCDAASALMLHAGSGIGALLLANPWTFDAGAETPAPQAIRARYASKLKNPRELLRLLRGGVAFGKLAAGLRNALRPAPQPSTLAEELRASMTAQSRAYKYLLAGNDRTGQAFIAAFPEAEKHWAICENSGHSFAEPHARDWLAQQVLAALHEQAG